MKRSLIAGALLLVALAGCSSKEATHDDAHHSGTSAAAAPGTTGAPAETSAPAAAAPGNHVKLGASEIAPINGVSCQSDGGVVTITVDAPQKTTLIVTDEDTPTVKSVSIGEAGGEGPSLVFLEGVSATPTATRTDKTYTVTGSGMGTDSEHPANPADLPFDIAVTCP